MGRIEEALLKLQQAERQGGTNRRAAGKPLPSAPGRALDHRYGGRLLEIDLEKLRKNGLLVPEAQQLRLVDQYRALKRPILRKASDASDAPELRNLIMVASAFAEEGKTFTAVNLSMSIAREQDWSVVLIDGDTSKRHLTHLLGAQDESGLTELLQKPELTFESLVMPTNIPRLAFLPAGQRDEQAPELLASVRMTTLGADISRADPHRAIVFDSSPLLLSPEAPILASEVGQVVLVVRANRTPPKAVLQARDRLDPEKAIGIVLNQADWGDHFGSSDYHPYGA